MALPLAWVLAPLCGLLTAQAPPSSRPRAAAVVEVVAAGEEPSADETQAAAYYGALLALGFAPVEPADRTGLTGTLTPAAPSVDDARAALLAARGRFKQMELSSSRAEAERGIAILLEAPNLPSHLALLSNLHLLIAEILLAEGRDTDARRELILAVRLQPERTLHPGLFPPPVVTAYADARKNAGLDDAPAPPVGALTVVTEPAEAQVLLNGQPLQRDERGVARVAAGDHYVVAAVESGASRGRRVTVPEGGHAALQMFVPPAAGARDRALLRGRTLSEAAHAALRVVPASVVVAYSPVDGRVAVAMAGVDEVATLPPGHPTEQLTSALQSLQAPAQTAQVFDVATVAAPTPAAPPPPPADHGPGRWPVVLGGTLAGGGAVAVVLLLLGAMASSGALASVAGVVGYVIWMQNQPKGPAKGRIVLGGNGR